MSCVQMCRSAHGISAGILCEIVTVFHSAILSVCLPPRLKRGMAAYSPLGREVVIHVFLYLKTLAFVRFMRSATIMYHTATMVPYLTAAIETQV